MKKCLNCKEIIKKTIYPSGRIEDDYNYNKRKFCSIICNRKYFIRENHPLWKDGLKHRPDGYIRDSSNDKYIHRIVMEKFLKRKLKSSEIVHHKDGNPSNNNISNLELTTNSKHRKLHCLTQKRNKGTFIK